MINVQLIRDSFDLLSESYRNRGMAPAILDDVRNLDTRWRSLQSEVDDLRHQLKSSAPKGKPSADEMAALKTLSSHLKEREVELKTLKLELQERLLHLPNILDPSVPVGADETDNRLIRTEGTPSKFDFSPAPHEVIAEQLDMVDFERAAKISGARFSIYKGLGAKLERALIQFMLDLHTEQHGYTEILPPVLVNEDSLIGTGQLPKFGDDSYHISDSNLWLSPTAEVQLTNFYRDEIIDESELPIHLTAYTPCFRKESGSYGKDIKGLIRLHQFNKVELVTLCKPQHSIDMLDRLRNHAEAILKALKLPYRVVRLCSGDTGFSSAMTYDLEVWFPAQNRYREISSCSNFLDFQARRAMIRYRDDDRVTGYLHTLNGSGLAVGRTFAALVENYQTPNGDVVIPDCLIPYMNIKKIVSSKD